MEVSSSPVPAATPGTSAVSPRLIVVAADELIGSSVSERLNNAVKRAHDILEEAVSTKPSKFARYDNSMDEIDNKSVSDFASKIRMRASLPDSEEDSANNQIKHPELLKLNQRHSPLDVEAFYSRLQTFTLRLWPTKPNKICSFQCARYGWRVMEKNMLVCVNCKRFISVPDRPYMSLSLTEWTKGIETCIKRTGHEVNCIWIKKPSPLNILKMPSGQDMIAFLLRVPGSYKRMKTFPLLTNHYKRLMSAIDLSGLKLKTDLNLTQNLEGADKSTVERMGLFLTIHGWAMEAISNDVVKCYLCLREVPLWVCVDKSSSAKRTSLTPCKELDPVEEHLFWCPWRAFLQTIMESPESENIDENTNKLFTGLGFISDITKMPVYDDYKRLASKIETDFTSGRILMDGPDDMSNQDVAIKTIFKVRNLLNSITGGVVHSAGRLVQNSETNEIMVVNCVEDEPPVPESDKLEIEVPAVAPTDENTEICQSLSTDTAQCSQESEMVVDCENEEMAESNDPSVSEFQDLLTIPVSEKSCIEIETPTENEVCIPAENSEHIESDVMEMSEDPSSPSSMDKSLNKQEIKNPEGAEKERLDEVDSCTVEKSTTEELVVATMSTAAADVKELDKETTKENNEIELRDNNMQELTNKQEQSMETKNSQIDSLENVSGADLNIEVEHLETHEAQSLEEVVTQIIEDVSAASESVNNEKPNKADCEPSTAERNEDSGNEIQQERSEEKLDSKVTEATQLEITDDNIDSHHSESESTDEEFKQMIRQGYPKKESESKTTNELTVEDYEQIGDDEEKEQDSFVEEEEYDEYGNEEEEESEHNTSAVSIDQSDTHEEEEEENDEEDSDESEEDLYNDLPDVAVPEPRFYVEESESESDDDVVCLD